MQDSLRHSHPGSFPLLTSLAIGHWRGPDGVLALCLDLCFLMSGSVTSSHESGLHVGGRRMHGGRDVLLVHKKRGECCSFQFWGGVSR
jgi:hypothetical protein